MENNKQFKAVSMDCNQEQFEQLRPHLEKIKGLEIGEVTDFEKFPILVNNLGDKSNLVSNLMRTDKGGYGRTYIGAFNAKAFIEACGGEWVEETPQPTQPETKFKEVPFNWETYLQYKDKGAYLVGFENKVFTDAYKFNNSDINCPIVCAGKDGLYAFRIDGAVAKGGPIRLKLFIPTTTKTIRVWVAIDKSGNILKASGNMFDFDDHKYQGHDVIELTKEIEL